MTDHAGSFHEWSMAVAASRKCLCYVDMEQRNIKGLSFTTIESVAAVHFGPDPKKLQRLEEEENTRKLLRSMAVSPNGIAVFITIPSRIGVSESNALQKQIQQLVTADFNEFYPKVIISYATGRRPTGDVEGAGPGLYKAADVIKALFNRKIPCFSGLMTPAGLDWKQYFLRLGHKNARVLVVLLSKAFFQSMPCLKEVHDAIEKGLEIISVRVEESESGASDFARDTESMWPDATIEKYFKSGLKDQDIRYLRRVEDAKLQRLKVRNNLGKLNTSPPRGTIFHCSSNGLEDLISQVRGFLTEHS